MFWFTIILILVNVVFLSLGLLLTVYAKQNGIDVHKDDLFPILAKNHLGMTVFIFFLIGLIAAAYSSADSALTSLTTSFSVDILNIEEKYAKAKQKLVRKQVHVFISILLILVIISFKYLIKDESVIEKLFKFAGFTYGPLLGLFAFGLFTKWKIKDKFVPLVAVLSVLISILINMATQLYVYITKNITWEVAEKIAKDEYYEIGFEILIINGLITFLGLIILIRRK